jgi:hypothetical protein
MDEYQIPKLLEDLRFIYENPGEEWLVGCEGAEKTLRELYRDHPAEFIERLDRLEREHSRAVFNVEKRKQIELSKKPKDVPVEDEVDEGMERALALCEEFLLRTKLAAEGANVRDQHDDVPGQGGGLGGDGGREGQ